MQRQKGSAVLISILVSLLIIALIGMYELQGSWNKPSGPSGYRSDLVQAKDTQIKADFIAIRSALDSYRITKGTYPENLGQLVQAELLSTVNKNPYTNTDYNFSSDGKNYTLSTKLGNNQDYQISN